MMFLIGALFIVLIFAFGFSPALGILAAILLLGVIVGRILR